MSRVDDFDKEIEELVLEEGIRAEFEVSDPEEVYDLISSRYPFYGTKIHFSKLEGSRYKKSGGNLLNDVREFVDTVTTANNISIATTVAYVGDDLTTKSYKTTLNNILRIMPLLLTFPQHHYIVPTDAIWCIFISFECDLEFGFAMFKVGEKPVDADTGLDVSQFLVE